MSHKLKAVHTRYKGQCSLQKELEQNPSIEKTRPSGGLEQPAIGGPTIFSTARKAMFRKQSPGSRSICALSAKNITQLASGFAVSIKLN